MRAVSTEDIRQDLARLALIALYPLRMVEHLTRPRHLDRNSHLPSPEHLQSAEREKGHR